MPHPEASEGAIQSADVSAIESAAVSTEVKEPTEHNEERRSPGDRRSNMVDRRFTDRVMIDSTPRRQIPERRAIVID